MDPLVFPVPETLPPTCNRWLGPLPLLAFGDVYATVQFPVTDLRSVTNGRFGRRNRPTWPFADVQGDARTSEFMPGFGAVRAAAPSDRDSWEGRAQYVPAARAVRYPAGLSTYLTTRAAQDAPDHFPPGTLRVQSLGRRYFGSTNSATGFVELALELTTSQSAPTWGQVQALVELITRLPVHVGRAATAIPIMDIGKELSTLVRRSTTANKYTEPVPKWLIPVGRPQLVMSIPELPTGTPPAQALTPSGGDSVWFLPRPECEVWVVAHTDLRRRKTIELHLSRLQAERAAFTAIMRGLLLSEGSPNPPLSLDNAVLAEQLERCADYVARRAAYGQDQAAMLQVLDWDLDIHGRDWDALRQKLGTLSPAGQRHVADLATGHAMSRNRVVAVLAELPDGRLQVGTGHLVGDRLVLTAEHCLHDRSSRAAQPATALYAVRASDGSKVRIAQVIAADVSLDVAVVALEPSTSWPAPLDFAACRVDRSTAGVLDNCEAIGYPNFMYDAGTQLRGTAELHGTVYQTDEAETGRLLLRERLAQPQSPADASDGQSPWGGLSGALVCYRDLALGVVVEHHPRQGNNAVRLIGFERIAANPQLRAALSLPAPEQLPVAHP